MRVFQTLIAFGGNATPQLAITRRLLARGHEVRVLAHEAARARVEQTGAQFVPFSRAQPEMDLTRREADTLRDWEPRTWLGAKRVLLRTAIFAFVDDVARDCSTELRASPADVVAFDWMLTGAAVAAEAAGLPAAALVHSPYPLTIEGAPPVFTGLRPLRGPAGVLRDRALNTAGRIVLNAGGLPILNRTRTQLGLAPLRDWEDQLRRVGAICVMTAPELDFSSRGRLPANVEYTGPAFEPCPGEWHSPWPESNVDPLVLISLSTSYMHQTRLAQRILDAVGGLPVRALLTLGPALGDAQLRLPQNTRSVAYLPHRAILPHTALVVTHAGWQTVNAALAAAVPLVCIPSGRDQPDSAARVVEAGAGVRLRTHTSGRRLRATIERALADSALKCGAQRIAHALACGDGAARVSELLERLRLDR